MLFRAIKKIKEDIQVIYDNDPAAKNIFEVIFCADLYNFFYQKNILEKSEKRIHIFTLLCLFVKLKTV